MCGFEMCAAEEVLEGEKSLLPKLRREEKSTHTHTNQEVGMNREFIYTAKIDRVQ